MNELKILINDYFKSNNGKFTKDELRHKFNIKGEQQTAIFNCVLNELVMDGCLFFDGKTYRLFTNEIGLAYGEIEVNKNGCGFVHTKDGYTILIENCDLNGALDGDKVIVSSINSKRKDFYSGEVYKVLKRKNGFVLFEVIGNGNNASLVPYNSYNNINISLKKNDLKDLIHGDIIKVKVGTKSDFGEYKATLESIVGHRDDPDIDIKILAEKYEIPIEFSQEAIKEANDLPKEVTEKDLVNRIDLRNKDIITIDCDNTKDRDDSVYVEKLDNGNFRLIVNISSVDYYIKKGMKLYEEAKIRCTSHYPINSCIPMFPHIISNGICSLNPNVDRLTKTCDMEIDKDGKIINIDVYNSVINSKKAMKYSDVNKVLNNEFVEGYEPFVVQLKLMKELSDILEKDKIRRCSLDFEIADIEVVQSKEKKPIEFKKTGIGEAEKIIENFMLAANTAIAEYFSWIPIIYRTHEYPDYNIVENAIKLINNSGIKIPKVNSLNKHSLKQILDSIKSTDEGEILKTILLKAMKRAKYDVLNCGHYALQLANYCHFTSPIRRISDFINHRIISDTLDGKIDSEYFKEMEEEAIDVSNCASYAERIDIDMENEARLMAIADFMQGHIGEEFEAYVTDISRNGMFIITKSNIPGKVKITDILDDNYHFDQEKNILVGRNTKNKYRIGNKIYAISKDASKENRTINFFIPKQKKLTI